MIISVHLSWVELQDLPFEHMSEFYRSVGLVSLFGYAHIIRRKLAEKRLLKRPI